MDQLNFNILFERENMANNIKNILIDFELNKKNLTIKRGIYIYGSPGSGKTHFIYNLLKELNYDIVNYDAGDIRNKSIIDTITENNMTDINVLSLLKKKKKPLAIIMDEIDGMNNGDKGGINALIKIIRPKKTKKQKLEELAFVPIICIGNYHIDKKINELIKVCHTFNFLAPSNEQIIKIISLFMPKIFINNELLSNILNYIQKDLRKLSSIYQIYKTNFDILKNDIIKDIYLPKSFNEDAKETTKKLINNKYYIVDHNILMNETDRTIVALLWHENIIEIFNKINKKESILLYILLLNNICIADYIDRITFQKQIWQFNEMSSLIKIFYNNYIFHKKFTNLKLSLNSIRFTKVLTKYSTEYNNYIFVQNFCQILNLDKKDLFSFFIKIKDLHESGEIYSIFESCELTKLDINRIYRYIDKYTCYDVNDCEITNENNIIEQ
jgi:DNA polymerase III delta prime subunit